MNCECWFAIGPPTTWIFCKDHAEEFDSLKKLAVNAALEEAARVARYKVYHMASEDKSHWIEYRGCPQIADAILKLKT